ncbi:NUC188 domain-containing protein, partial [Blastocladiella britannica]
YPPRRPNYHQHQGQAATTESGLPVPTAALPLWSSTDRAALLAAKHPESALNARRAKALIPGTRLRPRSNHDAVVPILAIRSGTVGGTSAPSLTLLIPTGYVLAVWRALTYAGARPIGERCTRSLAHEAAVPMWPYDWPGTLAHAADAAETGAAEEAKWRSRPRGKRVPYTRLEVDAPFVADWARVAGNGDGSVWVVPRTAHRPVVAELAATKPHPRGGGTSASAADRVSAVAARLASMAGPTHAPDAGKLLGSSVTGGNIPLVQTSLTFPGRGAASPNAMVYEMPARDVQAWERIVKRHAWDEAAEVNGARERVSTGKGDDEDVEYRPRKLVGYVTSGRFSLAVGRTRAIACVAMEAVLTNKWVLVRETSSPVVYPALVTVLNAVGP